ncbi:gliding motility-associated ABC transporter substrate-binding protein GldG [Flammeovirga kamogawensis]|uniref:Gliding motility-associated ABC transporter substrate-binding protein GldG n=1 Tax=Flammeovirga kamogawensis TaxID=373891 RepID=A0ABX8GWI8_9BACT|nr:gliding motility-associated ABC transporter substrate-binding protein GldG [Flammeovirga kamogawensis]MBB6461212.1 gliding-associated putative ABC transporter substrate-binding component GldG [Flammeovirga kamogawensis]QWG07774.1 gliding motility-associated ABC transporter substrate-binding protein GldG [Flammeovirga kamogawensis]TRX69580.1 gliding motility-associated ABC transporter substrate-binding protein GldG [Flammeovirga kamogawensis]
MRKWEDLLSFSAVLLFFIFINIHADKLFFRIDLTEEKRFSINPATERLLEELPSEVTVDVYLDGPLNAEFEHLKLAIQETLDEFKVRSNGKLEYRFIDPNDFSDPRQKQQFQRSIIEKGIPQTTLFDVSANGEQTQRLIFPGALISYKGKQKGVLLLKGNKAKSAQEQINQSIEGVEYELASVIQDMVQSKSKRLAIVQGHDELAPQEIVEFSKAANNKYLVSWVEDLSLLKNFDAILVAQPKKKFSNRDKYHIDQYLIEGGNALFLMDKVQMNTDSIPLGGTYAFGYDLNIDDFLFRIGIRSNINLIQDQQAGLLELVTGNFGDKANIKKLPWPYYIYLNSFSEHPIVRNMDVVYGKFVSSLDTIKSPGMEKTPLLFTSNYSRIRKMPNLVSLDEIKEVNKKELFNSPHLAVAYLLEGKFKSLYANRFPPKGINPSTQIKSSTEKSKIIVVGDGDIIKNSINPLNGQIESIEFDRFRGQSLSNLEFIMNSLDYLMDDEGLIMARNKKVTLRPLDSFKIREEKSLWQWLNVGLPVLLTMLLGSLFIYMRKKRFER